MNIKATLKKTAALKGGLLGFIRIVCFLIAAPQLAAQQSNEGKLQNQQLQQSQEMEQVKQ